MSLDAETMSIVEVMLERIERLESRAVENKWFDAWIHACHMEILEFDREIPIKFDGALKC